MGKTEHCINHFEILQSQYKSASKNVTFGFCGQSADPWNVCGMRTLKRIAPYSTYGVALFLIRLETPVTKGIVFA